MSIFRKKAGPVKNGLSFCSMGCFAQGSEGADGPSMFIFFVKGRVRLTGLDVFVSRYVGT